MLKILFDNKAVKKSPRISFLLIDWSCRESYHTINYLNEQNIPRDSYEIIWIEYYQKEAAGIKQIINDYQNKNMPPPLDKWVVMGMPPNVHYHKHLIYNIGIALSSGDIITILDSDSIVSSTLAESILGQFKLNENIILHMDEVRNNSRRFHPFNYPSIDEIKGEGCINWDNGKTKGLGSELDILHTRNYGACMCALRRNLIAIGGADEYIDYLGRMCGPYEMTFRLRNNGLKEIWCATEFLYHVWHPGVTEDAFEDYIGPSDAKNISLTALDSLDTKRVLPLLENEVLARLRSDLQSKIDLSRLISQDCLSLWERNKIREKIRMVHNHVLIEEGYNGYNIISFEGRFYALPQGIAFDINKSKQDEYFYGDTVSELKKLLTPIVVLVDKLNVSLDKASQDIGNSVALLQKTLEERSSRIISLEKALLNIGNSVASLQKTLEERSSRIVSLEKASQEVADRLILFENKFVEQSEYLSSPNKMLQDIQGRSVLLEKTLEERSSRIVSLEKASQEAAGRLVLLEKRFIEQSEYLSSLDKGSQEMRGRVASIEALLRKPKNPIVVLLVRLKNIFSKNRG